MLYQWHFKTKRKRFPNKHINGLVQDCNISISIVDAPRYCSLAPRSYQLWYSVEWYILFHQSRAIFEINVQPLCSRQQLITIHNGMRYQDVHSIYRQISNIIRTKSKNSNASRLSLQLSLCRTDWKSNTSWNAHLFGSYIRDVRHIGYTLVVMQCPNKPMQPIG